jgi:galactose mutarotase-like enzyme
VYTKNEYKEEKLTFIELRNKNNSSWLKVVPERGGIITSLGIQGEELLFLNEETLHNIEKNIRGGIPILFPISGQLTNGQYEWNGTSYTMKNHGFARDLPWEVVDITTGEEEASIKIKLQSSNDTLASYPFEFELVFTYILSENELVINQEYKNRSTTDMPIYAGFHPYFKTASKQLKLDIDAIEYLDYNDMTYKKIEDVINMNQKESYILESQENSVRFSLEEIDKQITMKYGGDFPYIVLWSEEGQDFVCVEPWMAKTDEMNKKKELTMIQSGKSLSTSVSISI